MLPPAVPATLRNPQSASDLWPPVFAVSGTGVRSSLHAHHAWHLMVGLDGPLRIQKSVSARPVSAHVVLVRPDVPHTADAAGHEVVVIFVNPESDVGARLSARQGEGIEVFEAAVADRFRAALRPARTREELNEGAVRALAEIGIGDARPVVRHRAVRRVLRQLRSNPPGSDESLEALAALSGVSASRLMHLFTEEVGVPLRPYLRWLKLERAALLLAAGASTADAAQGAGFADAAHMARSFRAMLGTTPAAIRRSQSVHADEMLMRKNASRPQ
jgi:AraC-like DNA-binding protein